MLYVLIMYCSGFCPDRLPAPSGALMFTSLKDCYAVRDAFPPRQHPTDVNGKLMKQTFMKQTCSKLYADPKQLDRLFQQQKPSGK